MFLKNWQNSQENTCARVSFLIKLQASAINYIRKSKNFESKNIGQPLHFQKSITVQNQHQGSQGVIKFSSFNLGSQ